jgi:hypothetical protein
LTQTFPTSENQIPVAGDPKAYPGVNNEENYSEGIGSSAPERVRCGSAVPPRDLPLRTTVRVRGH